MEEARANPRIAALDRNHAAPDRHSAAAATDAAPISLHGGARPRPAAISPLASHRRGWSRTRRASPGWSSPKRHLAQEDLLIDLSPPSEPPLQPAAPPAPIVLAPLPRIEAVSAEVISRPRTDLPRIALTFDACSTLDRSFYDDRITRVLLRTRTPATLFISGRWAETHLRQVRVLAEQPLFEIANHSFIHPHMTEVPVERQREELIWTQQVLLLGHRKAPALLPASVRRSRRRAGAGRRATGYRTVEYDFASGDPDKHVTRERLIACGPGEGAARLDRGDAHGPPGIAHRGGAS